MKLKPSSIKLESIYIAWCEAIESPSGHGVLPFEAFKEGFRQGVLFADTRTTPDPHELWAVAQLMPGEGIEDGVRRIKELLIPPYEISDLCPLEDASEWCPICGKTYDACENCDRIIVTLPDTREE